MDITTAILKLQEEREKPVFHCPECGRTWTGEDDPAEWAYGHDCEAE